MENNENNSICSACGGHCCKGMPGIVHPDEVESIKALLDTGDYAIDWWEGDPRDCEDTLSRALFIRPKIKGEDELMVGSWGGVCTFLEEEGCKLEFNERPYDCRMLQPSSGDSCSSAGINKPEMVILWLPFNDEMFAYAEENDHG